MQVIDETLLLVFLVSCSKPSCPIFSCSSVLTAHCNSCNTRQTLASPVNFNWSRAQMESCRMREKKTLEDIFKLIFFLLKFKSQMKLWDEWKKEKNGRVFYLDLFKIQIFYSFFWNLRKPKRRWRLPVSSLPSLRFVGQYGANMGTLWGQSGHILLIFQGSALH